MTNIEDQAEQPQPLNSEPTLGPVEGRRAAEIRADLACFDRDGVPWPAAARRLLADVPSLLAEVEAAHRFERSVAVEVAELVESLERVTEERNAFRDERNRVVAELRSLRGVVQAAEAERDELRRAVTIYRQGVQEFCPARNLAVHDFDLCVLPDGHEGEHFFDSRAALAAAADAPQPEDNPLDGLMRYVGVPPPAGKHYGVVPQPPRRVDLSEWDSHRPDFLPAGPSPAVLPEKEQRR